MFKDSATDNARDDDDDDLHASMLSLADDIGEMSDRIGIMADRIGDMADRIGDMSERILETQRIQGENVEKAFDAIERAMVMLGEQMRANNRLLEHALGDAGAMNPLD